MPPLACRLLLALALAVFGLPVLTLALDGTTLPLQAAPASPNTRATPAAEGRTASALADPAFEQRVLEVIRRNPAVLIEALNAYERQRQEVKLREQNDNLRRLYPRVGDLIGNAPRRGNGKLVMLMFSDFQCPYCAQAHDILQDFLQQRGQDVSFVYKHFPLAQIHPQAMPAARAAWAAGRQGQFWAYHDALFANQERLGDPLYGEIADALKLDRARFDADRNGSASLQAIQRDLDQAERLGLSGTPTLIIDQQFWQGPVSVEALKQRLEAAMANTNPKP